MAAKRPDFNQINKLISRLEALESDFIRIFGEEKAQLETLQEICRQEEQGSTYRLQVL